LLYFRFSNYAGVAELVDALDSGSSICKDVRVQVSPSAPYVCHSPSIFLNYSLAQGISS
jgi:hypothetical protein